MALKYLYVPSGVRAGTAYGVMPNSSSADFSSFSRSSAGSRVDKNGLINTGLGLGSEEVVNGSFSSDSNWTKGTGWAISNGVATYDGTGGTSFIFQNLPISLNTVYEIKITVVSNEGTGTNSIEIGNHRVNNTHLDAGTYTFYGTSTSGTNFLIYGRSGEELVIDNVSVREVTEVNTDVPRIDHTGGGCPSLLLEHTSTNKTQYSEDFTQSFWAKQGNPTIESDVEISPKGSLNASYLKAPVGTNISPRVNHLFGAASGQTYIGSVFVKKDSVDYIRLLSTGATSSTLQAYYNVSNGTLGTAGTPAKAKIEDYGNGWYRLILIIDSVNNTSGARFYVQLAKGDGVAASTYDGTEKNIIFGAQLENQSHVTSYIPNYGTAAGVTRSADDANGTGDISSAINEQEGVFFINSACSTSEAISTPQWISLSEGSSNNSYISIRYSTNANSIQVRYVANGGSAVQISTTSINRSNFNKIAFRWKANDFSLWINGSLIQTQTTWDIITANNLNRLSLEVPSGGQNLYGKTKEIRIYDKYENDAEMTKLTTL